MGAILYTKEDRWLGLRWETSDLYFFWFGKLFFHAKEKDRNLAGSLYEGGQLISSVLILDGWGDEQKTKYKFKLIAFSTETVLHSMNSSVVVFMY